MHRTLTWALALTLLGAGPALGGPPKVTPDPANVVASRLLGTWRIEPKLTERLMGKSTHKVKTVKITSDPKVLEQIPAKWSAMLAPRGIYLAGHLLLNGHQRLPFVLSSRGGNPHIVFFQPLGKDPVGNAESFYLMLAQGRDRTRDLLFLGGDMPHEPFMALERTGK